MGAEDSRRLLDGRRPLGYTERLRGDDIRRRTTGGLAVEAAIAMQRQAREAVPVELAVHRQRVMERVREMHLVQANPEAA